jgi:hypothetical protein
MAHERRRLTIIAVALAALLLATPTQAAVKWVENYGVDSGSCGATFSSPCRSISRALANAAAGDVILVGPGRYGDIDYDGAFTTPGDEAASSGMIDIGQRQIVISRRGAAATVIDGALGPTNTAFNETVGISAKGVLLEGFTITADGEAGVLIDTTPDVSGTRAPVVVAGNVIREGAKDDAGVSGIVLSGGDGHVILANQLTSPFDQGVWAVLGDRHVIAANTATSCGTGFRVDLSTGSVLAANQAYGARDVAPDYTGFLLNGDFTIVKANVASSYPTAGFWVIGQRNQLIANVASDNDVGFYIVPPLGGIATTMVADSAIGNRKAGVEIDDPLSYGVALSVISSNLFGNGGDPTLANPNCGILNTTTSAITATRNFWGSASGPGADPADAACNSGGGSITTTPFWTVRFP